MTTDGSKRSVCAIAVVDVQVQGVHAGSRAPAEAAVKQRQTAPAQLSSHYHPRSSHHHLKMFFPTMNPLRTILASSVSLPQRRVGRSGYSPITSSRCISSGCVLRARAGLVLCEAVQIAVHNEWYCIAMGYPQATRAKHCHPVCDPIRVSRERQGYPFCRRYSI